MTHKERVRTTLDHKVPDRCPMQISFTPEFKNRLRDDLIARGMYKREKEISPDSSYDVERIIGADMLLTSVGWSSSYYLEGKSYTDEWGIGWRSTEYSTRYGMGRYTEICGHPLKDTAKIKKYKTPDPDRPELFRKAEETIELFGENYWIVGATVTTIFETAWALRGLEQLLMDFILDEDVAEEILNIPFQYHLRVAENLVKSGVDMIWTGDDVGSQNSMILSPDIWRRFLKPKMTEFIARLKKINPQLLVAYHSDGYIDPIIPDLIEIGLDVLNPVQPGSMDPTEVKKKYGKDLSFWGTVDEQNTLPFGTPAEVSEEVRKRIYTVGKSGGLIIGPTHHVQLDTPMENFWAMVDTIKNTSYV